MSEKKSPAHQKDKITSLCMFVCYCICTFVFIKISRYVKFHAFEHVIKIKPMSYIKIKK